MCPCEVKHILFSNSLTSPLLPCNTYSGEKNDKPRSVMASDQKDNTLTKQSIATLQLSSTVALGRAVLAFSML